MTMSIHGTLFDGRSARARSAVVEFAGDTLIITPTDAAAEEEALSWPVGTLELAELPPPGAPVRLRCRDMPGAVLVVSDPEDREALARHLPHLLDIARRHGKRWLFAVTALAVSVLAVLGIYFGWPRIAREIAYRIPGKWEERMGTSAMSQLLADQVCANAQDRPGLDALDSLAGRLAAGSELQGPIHVHVMDWDDKNAFALPGGHVIFTSGIIAFMENPDELAGVLAHEMGHVEQRHVMISLIQNGGLSVLMFVVFGEGDEAGEVSLLLLFSAYSRELEREADEIGLARLARAGIGAAGFARFFERLQQTENSDRASSWLFDFVSTHPGTEERARLAREATPGGAPAMTAEEWSAVKAICGENRH